MALGFLVLMLGLLAGELAARWLGLPLPGAVVGMALLAGLLGLSRRSWDSLEDASAALLRYMPLLFVPAGVGVVQFAGALRAAWLPVSSVLLFGTLLSMAVTALTLRACLALQARGRAKDAP